MSSMLVETSAETRLAELACIANEHLGALRGTLDHALAIGEALEEAHGLVHYGEWKSWVAANFRGSFVTASLFRRLYVFREQLPDGVDGVVDAHAFLKSVDLRLPSSCLVDASEVQRLRGAGMSYRAVADELGVDYSTVWAAANVRKAKESNARKNKRWYEAKKALRKQEDARLAKSVGGSIGHAHGYVRQLTQALDAALGAAETPEARAHLNAALASAFKAEDNIGRALRADA